MRWTWGMVVALVLVQSPARAQIPIFHPRPHTVLYVSLEYRRGVGARVCPPEERVHVQLAALEGDDIFEPGNGVPSGAVRMVIERSPGGFTGWYRYTGAGGTPPASRTYFQPGATWRDCDDLIEMMAVSLAFQFDAREDELVKQFTPPPRPKAPPEPDPSGPMCPPASTIDIWPPEWPMPPLRPLTPDPPKPPERRPFAVRLGFAAWPELIVSGLGTFGFSGEVGARYRAFSFGAEVHGDPPLGSVTFPGFGTVSFGRASAALLACGIYGWFAGCAVGDVGRFLFPDHVRGLPPSARYDAAGVRVGMEFPVAPPWLILRTTLDLRAPIDPFSVTAAHANVFSPVGLSVGLGLGVLVELSP
jgi:hypothetical protein